MSEKPAKETTKRRIYELDLLRGFFIVVIIIDHLQFWPSPFGFVTGEGRLWVSAAEGFFLISGLLIGYIRAYKGKKHSLQHLTKLLWKRAAMLYVWGVGVTLAVVGLTLLIGGHSLLPNPPSGSQLASPLAFLSAVLSGEYFNSWIYFLRLYAIMLFVTPLFLYFIRKGQELLFVMLMLCAYLLSFWWPEAALQWQMLFFGAALIGYRFESIIEYFRERPLVKKIFSTVVVTFSAVTILLSAFFTVGWGLVESSWFFINSEMYTAMRIGIDPWFTNDPMQIGRIVLAFTWFTALLLVLNRYRDFFMRWLGWLLIPLGERSLSAYIVQALVLPFFVILVPFTGISLVNGLVDVVVVLVIWRLLQTEFVSKYVPR